MSLNYDLSNVENTETVCYTEDGHMKPAVEAIIFATMALGLSDITDKNLPEWKQRLNILDRVGLGWFGSITDNNGLSYNWFPDNALLDSLKGLHTNAGNTTRFVFWKSIMKQVDREVAPRVSC